MGKFKDISIEAEEQGQNPEDYWLEMSLKQRGDGSGERIKENLTSIQKLRISKPEWFKDDTAPF